MDQSGLTSQKISNAPWSGYSWPIYRGAMAQRYADKTFPKSKEWTENLSFAKSKNAFDEVDTDLLSPAEKFDLWQNDSSMTVTEAMWDEGRKLFDRMGRVETWFGFCHGWSVASLNVPRPARAVEVKSPNGQTIRFYPADIKGLVGFVWGNGNFPIHVLGGRCNIKNPTRDKIGRVIEPLCQDVNPGLWHIVLVNRLKQQQSFVFDATFDYEVWNQPVVGYEYTYFNPMSGLAVPTLNEATVSLDEYADDKFKKYRTSKASHIVGIGLKLTYLRGITPKVRST
jgi:hypothetical protein